MSFVITWWISTKATPRFGCYFASLRLRKYIVDLSTILRGGYSIGYGGRREPQTMLVMMSLNSTITILHFMLVRS